MNSESNNPDPAGEAEVIPEPRIPVVGIGASAGGVGALKSFFETVPADPGLDVSFVIVQHKPPESDRSMVEVVGTFTDLPVVGVEDATVLEPNRVYVSPGHKDVTLENNHFNVSDPDVQVFRHHPVDNFFTSLADHRGRYAIGVVLSGTGMDGTLGLKNIKNEGGLALAQDPTTAEFQGMPQEAINALTVDYVLDPAAMWEELKSFIEHPYLTEGTNFLDEETEDSPVVRQALRMLREETGHDLSGYKPKTLIRRMNRKMAISQARTPGEYLDRLREDHEERRDLFREFLIEVTRFFRDPETFRYLREDVLPEFIREGNFGEEVRVWVVGCSTGEEVYSLMMLLRETMDEVGRSIPLKVFATDINTDALEVARQGVYPERSVTEVDPEFLGKYFTQEEGTYRINQALRDPVIFAEHNLLSDPPYSDVDFVSCRNLMIYLKEPQQKKSLNLMHYALAPGGLLLLGHSETADREPDLFRSISTPHKIYRKTGESEGLSDHYFDFTITTRSGSVEDTTTEPGLSLNAEETVEDFLVDEVVPPAVLLDKNHSILRFFGKTEDVLKMPQRGGDFNVFEMCPAPLKNHLVPLLNASADTDDILTDDVLFERDGVHQKIHIEVYPPSRLELGSGYRLVVFHRTRYPEEPPGLEPPDDEEVDGDATRRVRELKSELRTTREHLYETIRELEEKNNLLQAKNQELQSVNEEYQSTNEELITSKEELQSTNEELITVNDKLEEKVRELSSLHDDMQNLLRATELPVIFLDRDLEVNRFTPAVREIFNLIDSDAGRPLSDITSKFPGTDFSDRAHSVLETLEPDEFEVQDEDGSWYQIKIVPYRSDNDVIEGVVITLNDVTEIREAMQLQRLTAVLKDSDDAILLFDFDGNITAWNRGATNMYGYDEEEALGMNVRTLFPESTDKDWEEFLNRARRDGGLASFRTRRLNKFGEELDVWLAATILEDEQGRPTEIATIERNLNWLPDKDE